MCTAISKVLGTHFFGRNLDLEYSLDEVVIITPQRYSFRFRCHKEINDHYAMIGMGIVRENTPLYYEATNEKGLSAAALSFYEAEYCKDILGTDNIASFEFIPWVLCQSKSVDECRRLLMHINITDEPFSKSCPPSPLHWIVSDKKESIVIECTGGEVKVYDNKADMLTNSPSFPLQEFNLNNYMYLSSAAPENRLSDCIELKAYSKGMGALGLPGDLSSMSRFIRGFFVKEKLTAEDSYSKNVLQIFHLLESVSMVRGTVKAEGGKDEYTVYSCCCDTEKLIYYYRTYFDFSIRAVKLSDYKKTGSSLITDEGKKIYGESMV